MQRVMNAEGNTTSYYLRAGTSWGAAQSLANDPTYSRFWQEIVDAPTVVTDPSLPQGALCFWAPRGKNTAGHVAIVYRINGRTFLIGNSSGNQALDVTYAAGFYGTINKAFLPTYLTVLRRSKIVRA